MWQSVFDHTHPSIITVDHRTWSVDGTLIEIADGDHRFRKARLSAEFTLIVVSFEVGTADGAEYGFARRRALADGHRIPVNMTLLAWPTV